MAHPRTVFDSPEGRIATTGSGKDVELTNRKTDVDRRVQAIALTGNKCLIEHRANSESSHMSIQLCHIFGRANSLNNRLMTSIEYFWGLKKYSLNLDSRYNCMYAGNDLHGMFDHGGWCLIPEKQILLDYQEATNADGFHHGKTLYKAMHPEPKKLKDTDEDESKDDNHYTYKLVPLDSEMKKTLIHRFHVEVPTDPSHFTTYFYPFNDLPPIRSHIHPKFVIISLGKLMGNPYRFLSDNRLAPYHEHLTIINALWTKWSKELRPSQEYDDEFEELDLDDEPRPPKNSTDHHSYKAPTDKKGKSKADSDRRTTRSLSKKLKNAKDSQVASTSQIASTSDATMDNADALEAETTRSDRTDPGRIRETIVIRQVEDLFDEELEYVDDDGNRKREASRSPTCSIRETLSNAGSKRARKE
ncbi:hypothetical protein CVT24_001732 [Panaeolus cyanescens]|uniref:HNH nuclease domain-containing protein n=1 Tax=Panaeolus cyanescens TaxID=181874 RepID=A0A409YFT1_9AGAR|nr:hypothetical protein CVT24_001732 [Panaeolus cyanescens]